MRDTTVINTVLGMVMPFPISLINQTRWSAQAKGVVALVLCALAALLMEWFRGGITLAGWRETAVIVVGAALVSYRVWWQPSQLGPRIEAATSMGSTDTPGRHAPPQ